MQADNRGGCKSKMCLKVIVLMCCNIFMYSVALKMLMQLVFLSCCRSFSLKNLLNLIFYQSEVKYCASIFCLWRSFCGNYFDIISTVIAEITFDIPELYQPWNKKIISPPSRSHKLQTVSSLRWLEAKKSLDEWKIFISMFGEKL